MSPFDICEAEFHKRYPTAAFWKEVLYYARHGVVHSTPEYFVMGRRVPKTATDAQILNLAYLFPPAECNAWFFAWFSGDMEKVWQADMEWLEYIIFQRQHGGALELQSARTEVMHRLTTSTHGHSSLQPSPSD